MQKIRIISIYFLLASILFGIFSPFVSAFKVVDTYDYNEYGEKINISSEKSDFVYNFTFDHPRTTFYLKFDDYSVISPDDVSIDWIVDGKSYQRGLDVDNLNEGWNTTFPFVSVPRQTIQLKLVFHTARRPTSISLITSDQSPKGKRLIWEPKMDEVYALGDAPRIVTRAEWGADESIRYIPQWKIDKARQDYEERGRTPRIVEETETEKARRIQGDKEYYDIISADNDANSVVHLTRYEDGHKLIFPIRTAKKINRIFIHHTAEGLDQDANDATLIRAIYLYHAKTRGWGDIGYNFIIGQRGAIYEGRAGGAYSEGAHNFANNLGTVGISVIGDYERLHLNRDQRAGLIDAITYVAKKYGINVNEKATGMKACSSKEECVYKKVTTYRLAGHRDAGSTDCPGEHIYEILPEIRDEVTTRVGNIIPVYNTETPHRDPLDPEDAVTLVIKKKDTPSVSGEQIALTSLLTPSPSLGGKTIKIRLSYPSDALSFRSATTKKAVVRMNAKIVPFAKGLDGSVFLSGDSEVTLKVGNTEYTGKTLTIQSDVIALPSWSRMPSWDNSKKYNDNLFRGKLYISNQGGKLLVVNELPIEDYLKGLGEVSDSDLPEKIKTILVAARGYAYFYSRPENRKYNTNLYDGSDNPDEFQKYLGYSYEMRSPNVARFVETTKGQVITYLERLIKPWYFSSSDGHTRSYKEYCETNNPGKTCEDIPYLQSVDDPAGIGKVRSGHGVGISGIGATYGASQGKNYKQIIAYYMSGVLIRNVNMLEN